MTWKRWRNKDAPCPFVPHCNPIALQHRTAEKRTSCCSSHQQSWSFQTDSQAVLQWLFEHQFARRYPKKPVETHVTSGIKEVQPSLRWGYHCPPWFCAGQLWASAKRQQERNRICTNGSFLLRVEKKTLLQQGETYPPWKWASAQNTSSFFTPLIFRSIWRKLYELSQQSYSWPSYCFPWETLRSLIAFLTLGCSII